MHYLARTCWDVLLALFLLIKTSSDLNALDSFELRRLRCFSGAVSPLWVLCRGGNPMQCNASSTYSSCSPPICSNVFFRLDTCLPRWWSRSSSPVLWCSERSRAILPGRRGWQPSLLKTGEIEILCTIDAGSVGSLDMWNHLAFYLAQQWASSQVLTFNPWQVQSVLLWNLRDWLA